MLLPKGTVSLKERGGILVWVSQDREGGIELFNHRDQWQPVVENKAHIGHMLLL